MAPTETKGTKVISQKLEAMEPGTPRYEVLEVAKSFKTSWVSLGSKLYEVQQKKLYEGWGFEKFTDYCTQEIHIKPQTASKLTASYSFLKTEDPAVLRRDGIKKPIPDLAVVDFLRRARANQKVPERGFNKIKELALEDTPMTELRREFREIAPREPLPVGKLMRQLMLQANRLADALAAVQGVPHSIVERALALVDDLKGLAE